MFDSHRIYAHWGARVETPAALAKRFIRMIDALSPIHPLLNDWGWIDGPSVVETEGAAAPIPWHAARVALERRIVRNMGSEDDGVPDPFCGYWLPVITNEKSVARCISLAVSASIGERGGSELFAFMNRVAFGFGASPDPSLLCFDVQRGLVLTVAEEWEATLAETSNPGRELQASVSPVRPAWMSYVSPHYARLITPPASAIIERRPNGGLFVAATRDVFEAANPAHLAAAREIEAALQPLNAVPHPNDAPYY